MPNGNGDSRLLGPGGRPINPPPHNVIVIKSSPPLTQQFVQSIAKATGCSIINIPLTCEYLSGDLAIAELEALHNLIHSFLNYEDKKVEGQDV